MPITQTWLRMQNNYILTQQFVKKVFQSTNFLLFRLNPKSFKNFNRAHKFSIIFIVARKKFLYNLFKPKNTTTYCI